MTPADTEARLAEVFMLSRVEIDFGDAECSLRVVGAGERRAGRSRRPTYDPVTQFELTLVARGVRRLRFIRELAGRPGFEGIQVESLAGRQYETLGWRVRDMETSVFEFWCASLEVDGFPLDPLLWPREGPPPP